MDTISNNLNIQDDAFTNIKLPPVLKQAFSIDNHQAQCKICDFTCALQENYIIFHLMMCRGRLIGDNIKIKCNFNCLMCSFETKRFHEWRFHLFKLKHISEHSHMTKYSYDCNSCNTHFYGFKDKILQHQCKPKSLSILSELMAYASKNFDIQHKKMLYFCSKCENYSYNVNDLHMNKCEALINSGKNVCESCLITFYETSEKTFLNHQISFEHIILKCLNGERKKNEQIKSSGFPRLPIFITKYFEISHLLRQFRCIVCCKIFFLSYFYIYDHFIKCISSKEISCFDFSIPLNSVNCRECNYTYSNEDENMYEDWVKHIISLEHLNKISKSKQTLYSYYSFTDKTIYYGTEMFVTRQALLTNDRNEFKLFVTRLMADVYKHSNSDSNLNLNRLDSFGCGFCRKIKDDQSEKYCEHENIDSSQLFYCPTCLIKFNILTDYTKHLLSSEHIILKYFKPNQISELRYLEYSLKIIQECLSNLNESDDDNNEYFSLSDQNSINEEMCLPSNNDNIETQNVLDGSYSSLQESKCKRKRKNEKLQNQISSASCSTEVDCVLNCVKKLSAESEKSALNDYLRMKFELLNQMPHAINVFSESKSFFCSICDSVFCEQFNWTKHYEELHNNIINPLVFYCSICHIYHISTSISISDHIQTVEHSVMLEFQENTKNKAVKPILQDHVIITPTLDNIQNPKEDKWDKAKEKSKKIKKNSNIYIQIMDIDANLKRNNYSSLNNFIKKKYGKFTQIANKSNLFIILFKKMNQVDNFINDEKELEKQYGFKLEVLGKNKELSLKTKELFSDWKTYNSIISNHLKIMKSIGEAKVKELCDAVCDLNIGTDSIHVHVFGSRLYKLATEKSDVDLYLDIGGTFNGDIADDIDRQVDLVKMFAQQCYLKCDEFKNVEEICDARVPIIKFYHVPTKFNCDVSFKSGLSVYKSELIKLYLSSHIDVKWLVCAVKCWALENNLIDKTLFTSYALVWLVLFYLMTRKIIPPIVELVKNATKDDQKIIEGWDCTFGKLSCTVNGQNRPKLLLGFFEYYANKKQLKNHVLSTFTGKIMTKNMFFQNLCKLPELSEIQREKFKTFQSKVNSSFVNYYGLAVHDPFELPFNITRNIYGDNLTDFCELCDQSENQLSNI